MCWIGQFQQAGYQIQRPDWQWQGHTSSFSSVDRGIMGRQDFYCHYCSLRPIHKDGLELTNCEEREPTLNICTVHTWTLCPIVADNKPIFYPFSFNFLLTRCENYDEVFKQETKSTYICSWKMEIDLHEGWRVNVLKVCLLLKLKDGGWFSWRKRSECWIIIVIKHFTNIRNIEKRIFTAI